MTLNGHFALKSVSGSVTNGLAPPASVRKFAELPTYVYCQQQKCSPCRERSFWQYKVYADIRGIPWGVGSIKSVVVENGDFSFYRSLSSEGHTTAFTWCDCRWPWAYFKVIILFRIKFLKNHAWFGKCYYLTTNRKSYTSFRLVAGEVHLKVISA